MQVVAVGVSSASSARNPCRFAACPHAGLQSTYSRTAVHLRLQLYILGTTSNVCANKSAWLKETSIITDRIEAARVAEAEAVNKEAISAAKVAPPEEADEAKAVAIAAKGAAEAALDAVPERPRAKGVWSCAAAIGDDSYVTFKLKELDVMLGGSGTDADKGKHFTIASEVAVADPNADNAAIQYSLQARVDWVMGVHHTTFPKKK